MTEMPHLQQSPIPPAILPDIYARLAEISAALAAIHEQLKAIPDHEQRVRRLEASRAKLIGAAVAVSATVSALGTWLGLALTHH
jgi:hypothetical protein